MIETLENIYHRHKRVINGITWPDKFETHSYGEVYEEILAPYRQTAKNILEIGLFGGESLRMWEDYFTGKVYGIDCSETPHDGMADLRPMITEGTHNIHIFDAANSEVVNLWYFMGPAFGIKFDVIIEDAGHDIEQQLKLYEVWKPYLAGGGIYIIEDIQDIERFGHIFMDIKGAKIIDRRNVKNRYDDVMVIIK